MSSRRASLVVTLPFVKHTSVHHYVQDGAVRSCPFREYYRDADEPECALSEILVGHVHASFDFPWRLTWSIDRLHLCIYRSGVRRH